MNIKQGNHIERLVYKMKLSKIVIEHNIFKDRKTLHIFITYLFSGVSGTPPNLVYLEKYAH